MLDFTQSAKGLQPATVVDHILLPVADLDAGAQRLYEQYGLRGMPGGPTPERRHRQCHRAARPAVPRADRGRRPGGGGVEPPWRARGASAPGRTDVRRLALRTQDLVAVRASLQAAGWDPPPIAEGSRKRPDGQVLSWRTQDVGTGAEPSAIPFVIEWRIADGLHPGEAASSHRGGPAALRRVVVGARDPRPLRDQIRLLLGDSPLYEVREAGVDGVQQVVLETGGRELVIE